MRKGFVRKIHKAFSKRFIHQMPKKRMPNEWWQDADLSHFFPAASGILRH